MTNIPSDQKTLEAWFIDGGCSNHMTGLKPVFKELNEGEKLKVELGNGKVLQVEGKGTVEIETHHGNRILTNVQYVPDIGYNLLSVGQLMESRYSILFDDGACLIKNKQTGRVLAKVKMTQSKMFPLEVSNVESFALTAIATNTTKNNSELWHLRYGHLNIKGLSLLNQRDMVIGLPKISAINICKGCVYGKQTRKSFPIGKALRASKCLELIHADLCGPMQTKSLGKGKKQSGMFIKSLRSDRGGEFLSNNFNHFCKKHGIHRELTTPYTPEQNGVAERKNRTVVEMTRSMLQMKGLSNDFWAEAVSTSIYLLNISPTKAVMNKTPFEVCEEYVSLVDGELTNDGEQTVVESSMETPTSTPPSSTPSTPQSYHSSSSNDEHQMNYHLRGFGPWKISIILLNLLLWFLTQCLMMRQQAMKEEMAAIEKNGTWKMVDLPEGKNAIGLKWVYKSKFAADGSLEKHKAHLVAKGYAQQHGIDFKQTLSPIALFETVKIVLALEALQQWPVYQFDVKSAFLNGELQEEVYVEQPEGFVKKDSEEKV
ncbi:retrovirus-related Pol polyprotein from transposon TNT 1-94 [Cucumis melo var. makuwa]|uniref:Retrovirus-related Pol polyprotein from transposon TNT 1-94 n=1 Tax=Cucumis melo var. makuwa TaxID=1194695 RepID=A0A5A7VF84_CUCMM|nr:retrovirus-related Pol polyprotein from transposon TNT 1-94 [Cucumis melo var. makuwa]